MKGGEEAISDVGFFPAVAGRAYARIFDSREECSRAQSRETRIAHAKAAKVGKDANWIADVEFFPAVAGPADAGIFGRADHP